jgi:hypothetical protein
VTAAAPSARVFRLPRTAYLIVIFLAAGAWPTALYGGQVKGYSNPAQVTPLIVLFLIPVVAGFFVARTATIVDGGGVTVRAAFGSRRMRWDEIRGLSIDRNTVYAVLADGSVRLPCVHIANLSQLARASSGRLPQLPDPQPKAAPARARRRR